MRIGAICLAAGRGKRMKSNIQKQYLLLEGKPVLYYSLKTFQESRVDEIVLVVPEGQEEYGRKEIVEKYGFSKVKTVISGGQERYHSVIRGLHALTEVEYVLIHDGARPFLSNEIIERCVGSMQENQACVVGMPVKDTIKIADKNGYINATPDRSKLWQIQTPQAFHYSLIKKAYELLEEEEKQENSQLPLVTDDAMVVEYFMKTGIQLVEGSYQNIKITTPEDMIVASAFLREKEK